MLPCNVERIATRCYRFICPMRLLTAASPEHANSGSCDAQDPKTTGDYVKTLAMPTVTGATISGKAVVFGALAAILCVIGVSAQTRQFDRQTFLAAVEDRLKTQSEIMEARSDFNPLWDLDDRRTAWQNDIASIPGLTIPSSGGKASFGIALAYIASQESSVTFASRRGDGLVHLVGADESRLSISLDVRFRQFGQELLRAMFNEKVPCSSQGFFHYTPSEVQFANSICTDLKQTVHNARQDYAALRVPSVRPPEAAKEPGAQTSPPPSVVGNQQPDDAPPAKEINPQQSPSPAGSEPQTTPLVQHPEAAPQERVATGGRQTSSAENVQRTAVVRSGPDGFLGFPIDSGLAIGMIVLFTLIIAAYCLPAIIAFSRRHRNRWVILAINFAFGATLIGWVIALVWALNKVDAPVKGGIKYDLQPHDPVL